MPKFNQTEEALIRWSGLLIAAHEDDPCLLILAAILDRSLKDLFIHNYSYDSRYFSIQAAHREAVEWFTAPPSEWTFSFWKLCEYLGVDAERLLTLLISKGYIRRLGGESNRKSLASGLC